jgi:hypothetical protein
MRCTLVFITGIALVTALGCSGVSTVEKANLTNPTAREGYVKTHAGDLHTMFVRDGEITRGMSADEVIASWGMPNVYSLSRTEPSENWIYYVRARDSAMILIYTLTFRADTLAAWDIEHRRLVGQAIVSTFDPPREVSPRSDRDARKR